MILKINSVCFHTQHSPTGISDESVLCSLRGTKFRIILMYQVFNYFGTTMAEAVSFRSVTSVAWVQFQVTPCEICGGQSGIGTGLSSECTSVFPSQ